MSEYKMSDKFNLPLSPAGLFHKLTTLGVKGKCNYIAHAINSHDNLVDQIAQLKDEKAELVKSLTKLCECVDSPDEFESYSKAYSQNCCDRECIDSAVQTFANKVIALLNKENNHD